MSSLAAALMGLAGGLVGGLLGVGGGILFVPALTIFLDESQVRAEATSLLAIVPVAIVAVWRQLGYGNVRVRDGLVIGALSPLGVGIGVVAANTISQRALELIFAGLALVIASQLAVRALRPTRSADPSNPWILGISAGSAGARLGRQAGWDPRRPVEPVEHFGHRGLQNAMPAQRDRTHIPDGQSAAVLARRLSEAVGSNGNGRANGNGQGHADGKNGMEAATARKVVVELGATMLADASAGTAEHSDDVVLITEAIGERMGVAGDDARELLAAARLHDIGKACVPKRLLEKSGPLTDEEWALMRQHTVIGEQILSSVPELETVARLVRGSHERWDGGGYPDGLAGEADPTRQPNHLLRGRLPRDPL